MSPLGAPLRPSGRHRVAETEAGIGWNWGRGERSLRPFPLAVALND